MESYNHASFDPGKILLTLIPLLKLLLVEMCRALQLRELLLGQFRLPGGMC